MQLAARSVNWITKKNNGKIYYELTIPTSLTCKDLLTTKDLEITDTLPAGVTFDISNVITVGALSLNDDGSVPHQVACSKQFMVLTAGQTIRFRHPKNFDVSKKSIGATDTDRTITFTIKSGYNVLLNHRFSISVTGSALQKMPLGTIFVRKTSTATAQNGTADKAETETTVKRSYESFIRPALSSMKAPMTPAISLRPRRSTTALLSTHRR